MLSLKWAISIGVALAIIVSIAEHRRRKSLDEYMKEVMDRLDKIGKE